MDTAELRALFENITSRPGHMSAMGTRVVAVEPGHVHLAIDRRPDLLQFSGHFHGGVIAALADHGAGGAVTTALSDGRIAVTIDLHVNFLAPANGTILNAKARAVQVGSTVGVAQVDLTTNNEGAERMCAIAFATLRVVDSKSAIKSV